MTMGIAGHIPESLGSELLGSEMVGSEMVVRGTMTHRHGLLLSAVLLLVTGCAAGTTTPSQTSMLRGPTPSSGMTIPRLLTASAPPNFSSSVGSEFDTQETGASGPAGDPSGAESTDDVTPPGSGDVGAVPTEDLSIPTEALPTDLFPTDGSLPDDSALDPGTGVDLSALATTFGCADYAAQSALPLTTGYGQCPLAGEPVQLYSFATAEDQGTFIQQLVGQGVSVDALVQGGLYIVIPGPTQLDTVRAALTPG
jgi:hypothetical protein